MAGKEVKGVIFDMDGVLLDTMHVWTDAGARYLASLGKEAEPRLGDKLFSMTVDTGAVYLKERYDLPQSISEIIAGINGVVEDYYHFYAPFKPGARALLERLLQAEIPVTIASSTAERYITAAMDRLCAARYFKKILSCVELGTSKSEPKIFFEAMKIMGSEPENTYLFEDGLYSIETAKKAGLNTVGVYDAVSAHEQEKIKETADVYVKSLLEFTLF